MLYIHVFMKRIKIIIIINHQMYADDICFLTPSALGLQKLLDVCYNFSQCNDIAFNS